MPDSWILCCGLALRRVWWDCSSTQAQSKTYPSRYNNALHAPGQPPHAPNTSAGIASSRMDKLGKIGLDRINEYAVLPITGLRISPPPYPCAVFFITGVKLNLTVVVAHHHHLNSSQDFRPMLRRTVWTVGWRLALSRRGASGLSDQKWLKCDVFCGLLIAPRKLPLTPHLNSRIY